MITERTFTKEWLQAIKYQDTKANIHIPLLEKMTYALLLAELLKINGLEFIFKGGTSLILLLDVPQRFSIDIDIITKASKEEIELVLTKICKSQFFTNFELEEARSYKEGVPKAHYKFRFNPNFSGMYDNTILLDILFDENPYPKLQEIAIKKNWIDTIDPITKVLLPTVESITGDKLTAFAPNTIGIRYGCNKSTEIIKQMFDLGQLFNKIIDFEVVAHSFLSNAPKELSYRPKLVGKTVNNVLDDILQTCFEVVTEK